MSYTPPIQPPPDNGGQQHIPGEYRPPMQGQAQAGKSSTTTIVLTVVGVLVLGCLVVGGIMFFALYLIGQQTNQIFSTISSAM